MNLEPLSVTVERFNQELLDRNYSQFTRWQYGKICRDFLSWCNDSCITAFSEKIAKEYCLSKCGTWDCGFKLPQKKRKILRCIRMLNSSYCGLEFERRIPLIKNEFHTRIGNHIQEYENWCADNLHLAQRSIRARIRFMSVYDNYLYANKIDIGDITTYFNDEYFSKCTGSMMYRRTRKHYLREFFKFLYEHEYSVEDLSLTVVKDPIVLKKEILPSVYSIEEIREILLTFDRSTAKGKRDYIAMLLAAEYGLRASDIVQLRMTDIDWDKNEINIVQYKTKKPLTLPLTASVGNAIIDFMKNGHPHEGGSLIICHLGNVRKGEPLHPSSLTATIGGALQIMNLKTNARRKIGPHSFRHSLASNMLDQGISMLTISSVLGHSLKQSTQAYLKLDLRQLAQCSLPIPPVTPNGDAT